MTTTTALESRVRRALAREDQRLVKPRSASVRQQLGEYFVVNALTYGVVSYRCDLEALAAELGVNA